MLVNLGILWTKCRLSTGTYLIDDSLGVIGVLVEAYSQAGQLRIESSSSSSNYHFIMKAGGICIARLISLPLSRSTLNRFYSLLAIKTLSIKSCLVPFALLCLRQDKTAEGTTELGDIWVTKGLKSQIFVRWSPLMTYRDRNASGTPARYHNIIHQHRLPPAKASGVVINGNAFNRKDNSNLWGSRTVLPSDAGKSSF